MVDVLDRIVSEESLIRRNWLPTEAAADAVVSFEERFGEGHLRLACFAAFPVVLTPELINLVRLNFLDKAGVPWIAEQDFLLSSLCRPVGEELFEVEPRVREVLLVELEDRVGATRVHELAEFLLGYTESPLGAQQRPEINQLQRWIALAYVAPERLVGEMTETLLSSLAGREEGALSPTSHIKIATAYEFVADVLERSLPPEEYGKLAANSRLMAYYWYGDRRTLRQSLREAATAETAAASDPATQTLTVFLDWVRRTPAPAPALFSEELPPHAPTPWSRDELLRAEKARELLEVNEVIGAGAYTALAIIGDPSPARTEFVRWFAEERGRSYATRLYLDLQSVDQPDAAELQTAVIQRLKPAEGVPPGTTLRALYIHALAEHPTLIVLDNASAWLLGDLMPPTSSLLVITSNSLGGPVPPSTYVFDFDRAAAPAAAPTEALLSPADVQFLTELLSLTFVMSDRPISLVQEFISPDVLIRLPVIPIPNEYAALLVNFLTNRSAPGLVPLIDFLLKRHPDEENQRRLGELRQKLEPAGTVEQEAPSQTPPSVEATLTDEPTVAPASRARELERIVEALLSNQRPLVIIEGAPGSGKTSLASMVAETPAVREKFSDGVLSLNHLFGYDRIEALLPELARQLGVPESSWKDQSLRVRRRLLSQKKILLILDEPFGEPDVERAYELVPAPIIYTTRFAPTTLLSLPYALRVTLGPLTLEDSLDLLKRLAPAYADYPELEAIAAGAQGNPELLGQIARNLNEIPREEKRAEHLRQFLPEPEGEEAESTTASGEGTTTEDATALPHDLPPPAPDLSEVIGTAPFPVVERIIKGLVAQAEGITDAVHGGAARILVHGSRPDALAYFTRRLAERLSVDLPDAQFYFDARDVGGHYAEWEAYQQSLRRLEGRRALIIVDNADPEQLAYLTGPPPGSVLVVTSSTPFPPDEAYTVDLDSLIHEIEADAQAPPEAPTAADLVEKIRAAALAATDVGEKIPAAVGERLEEVNVRELIEGVTRNMLTPSPRVDWSVRFNENRPLAVRGDRTTLSRLFAEVIENARDAVAGVKDARIVVSVSLSGDMVRVEVRDNGPGIPAELRDRIFHTRETNLFRGEGRGLYEANAAARRYGGSIKVVSTRPGETIFRIELPAVGATRGETEEEGPAVPLPPQTRVARHGSGRVAPGDYLFYLSYARQDGVSNPYLRKFYEDLSWELARMSGLPSSDVAAVGFFDVEGIEAGYDWGDRLGDALQRSKSLVCLYSPSYFASAFCGKEFEVFRMRLDDFAASTGGPRPPLILPVLWQNPSRLLQRLPEAVRDIQAFSNAFGEVYNRNGLQYTMRLQRHEDVYRIFLRRFAGLIGERVREYDLPPLPSLPPLKEVRNAFEARESEATGKPGPSSLRGPRVVHAAFVAVSGPDMFKLRSDPDVYGEEGRDWRPFGPQGVSPVGERLAQLVSSKNLIYTEMPVAEDLIERLRAAEQANSIVTMLVDPWTLGLDKYQRLMSEFDQHKFINCAVFILWNQYDKVMVPLRTELERVVRETFANYRYLSTFRSVYSWEELERALTEQVRQIQSWLMDRGRGVSNPFPPPQKPTL